MVIQETEEANLTSCKEEHSNLNSVSQHVQSPNLSLHSAKRRQDMIESDSNEQQAERLQTTYNYELSRIIFKLVLAPCPLVTGLESGRICFSLRSAIYYILPVILWCRKNSN